jgi:hypothetical protein
VGVRDAVKHGTLRDADKNAIEVAGKWEELVSFAVLRLGRKLGADVQEVLSKKERTDISLRIANIVEAMTSKGTMPGAIRIPNTVNAIQITADIRAQQIVASIKMDAPKTGRSTTKINWLLRQLKSSSADVRLDSWGSRSRSSMSDLLGAVRTNQELLIPIDNREIVSFTISLSQHMGVKRSSGKNSFVDSVLDALDAFYADVVQYLREWQPPAPKLKRSDAIAVAEPTKPQSKASNHTAIKAPPGETVERVSDSRPKSEGNVENAAPDDSLAEGVESTQRLDDAESISTGLHSRDLSSVKIDKN